MRHKKNAIDKLNAPKNAYQRVIQMDAVKKMHSNRASTSNKLSIQFSLKMPQNAKICIFL